MAAPDAFELRGFHDFELIARGAGSVVYRALQDGVDRPVAIKVRQIEDPAENERFQRGVGVAARLGREHPYIATVIATAMTPTGYPYLATEYYDGGSLHDRLVERGPLDSDQIISIGVIVANALAFAHQQRVVHGGIKPQNVLLLPTACVVADFGIARRVDPARPALAEYHSLRHASPQVLDGDAVTPADEIWSVGALLFTLLDGTPPYAWDDDARDYLRRVRGSVRRPLRRRDIPPGLLAVIDQCLQRDRGDRFPDAAALHDSLEQLTSPSRTPAPGEVRRARAPEPAAGVREASRAWTTQPAPGGWLQPRAADPPEPVSLATDASAQTAAEPLSGAQPAAEPPPARAGSDRAGAQPGPSPVELSQWAAAMALAQARGGPPQPVSPGLVPPPEPQAARPRESHRAERMPPGGDVAPAGRPPARRGWRIAVNVLIAVVIGAALGWTGAWVTGRNGSSGPPSLVVDPPPTSAPTASGLLASPAVNNLEIAPVISDPDVTEAGVIIRWQDTSGSQAAFIIVRVIDGHGKQVRTVPAGSTETLIADLDPPNGPYCFLVIAVVGQERGVSPTRCSGDQR